MPRSSDYDDVLADFEEALNTLIEDVLEDEALALPIEPDPIETDDEETDQ